MNLTFNNFLLWGMTDITKDLLFIVVQFTESDKIQLCQLKLKIKQNKETEKDDNCGTDKSVKQNVHFNNN